MELNKRNWRQYYRYTAHFRGYPVLSLLSRSTNSFHYLIMGYGDSLRTILLRITV